MALIISTNLTPTKLNTPRAGSGSEGAQTNLQESYSDSFTLEEAETLAISTLKQVGGAGGGGEVGVDGRGGEPWVWL